MVPLSDLAEIARANGAPLCGAAKAADLSGNAMEIGKILPGACSVVVLAAPHSRSAIESADVQMAQYDTVHAYAEAARASHALARWLEARGHRAVAVPAFIPIDMAPPKHGMKGAIDWREAGVLAGIGGYGESGLLVTREYGPAARVGGVLTDAEIAPGSPLRESPCTHCQRCVESCPTGALSGGGRIDKRKCGEKIFSGGYRAWRKFLLELIEASPEKRKEMTGGQVSLELWQNFMTGNYYYCFACQSACPVGRAALA
ncbi:MAG TPA: 4Fe-4S double cluster binding domain-containing protein [Candidatus Deferrimicrobiaceae bacterium]|nr:4Fe-4S double cluster binding domain-containing protein [Candidatus Deferrimicrobiaceae bacterium]